MKQMRIEGLTRDGELLSLRHDMNLRGRVLTVGWEPPEDLTKEEWRAAGELLGKLERSVNWWIGDWWTFGESRYGDRKTIVEADAWEGPDHKTCMNIGSVARAFETSRRREVLSFKHHSEVAALSVDKADELLDWCEETVGSKGRPRSVSELRQAVNRLKIELAMGPTLETLSVQDLDGLIAQGRKYGCIYADPPWLYANQGTRAATSNHYKGLTLDELCALPVGDLAADDAHLHMWITNGFLFDAPRLLEAWGFEFRSTFVWIKPQMGIGNYWRNSHEIMLTAVRGDALRFNDHAMMSYIICDRSQHSEKPEQVRSLIERASGGPYLELFARTEVPNWTVWGNQVQRSLLTSFPPVQRNDL